MPSKPTRLDIPESSSDKPMDVESTKNEATPKIRRCWLLRILFPENVTTQQIIITMTLFLSNFGNSLTFTMVFAYLPRMTRDFGIPDVDIGTYAGIIASSIFVGRAIAGYFWGTVVDRFGRRRTTLISTTLIATFTMLFGFNWSYTWVTFARFTQGFVNGIVVSTKAAVVDISDRSNQGSLMNIVLSGYSVGLIVGPTLGGFLALPHEKYPSVFSKDSLFGIYPFLLPNFIAALIMVLSIILTYFFQPETLKRKQHDVSEKKELLNGHSNPSYTESNMNCEKSISETVKETRWDPKATLYSYDYAELSENYAVYSYKEQPMALKVYVPQDAMLEPNGNVSYKSNSISRRHFHPERRTLCCGCIPCLRCPKREKSGSTFMQLMSNLNSAEGMKDVDKTLWNAVSHDSIPEACPKVSEVRTSILLYGVFSFVRVAFEELIPVYAATYTQYHGLSFSTADIGSLLLAQTAPNILTVLVIAPKLELKLGPRKLYIISMYLFTFILPLIPCCSRLPQNGWLWAILISELIVIRIAVSLGFLCVNLFNCNSVERHQQGAVNGLGMAVSAAFRAMSPIAVGSIFSWSLKNGGLGFPFNYFFAFLLLSFLSVCTLFLLITLPKSIDKKKSPPVQTPVENGNAKVPK